VIPRDWLVGESYIYTASDYIVDWSTNYRSSFGPPSPRLLYKCTMHVHVVRSTSESPFFKYFEELTLKLIF
jgi:hypothetical protein